MKPNSFSFHDHPVKRVQPWQDRRVRVLAAVTVVLMAAWAVGPVAAEVYECRGSDGKTVLTNRPKGLRGCVLLDTMTPSSPSRSSPPPVLHDLEPAQVDPLPLPMSPLPPHGVVPDPPAPTDPDTPAADVRAGDESRCQLQLNPLNPLSGSGCPPAAAE